MKAKNSKKRSGTDWEQISIMKDNEIDFSDNPELTDSFFTKATLLIPEPKKSISLRIDQDILEWYKKQGPGYQTRMNAVLRMYMQSRDGRSEKKNQFGGKSKNGFTKSFTISV